MARLDDPSKKFEVHSSGKFSGDSKMAGGKTMHAIDRSLLQWPFIVHIAFVMAIIWIMSLFGANHSLAYVLGFIFLFQVERRYYERIRKRIRHAEWKNAARKQLLSDFETVRWLNEFLDSAWPAFLEKFASAHFLGPLMPFFLERYKPWTVQEVMLQSFSLGRTPPTFSGMRTVDPLTSDDNMVLEGAMEFVAADDMSAVLSVQLKKRFGGIWSKVHISNMHIEGKVRIGIKFIGDWPFVSRLRISFESVPYVQITARPVSNLGMDVAELPGIASWLDAMLLDALVDSIVKPNMLEINVEKIASLWSALPLSTMSTNESPRVATVLIEILEAIQLRSADANGFSDPFVKGQLNASRFKSSVKRKTLNPKWMEEFRLPVRSWDEPNRLILRVRDKDLFRDDNLGYCEMLLNNPEYRDGQRHEFSIPLKGVKMGRLNLAITVEDMDTIKDKEPLDEDEKRPDLDQHEVIQQGIFSILRPGRATPRQWVGRKGRNEYTDNVPDSGCLELDVVIADSDDEKEKGRRFWKWGHRGTKGKTPVSGELLRDGMELKVRTSDACSDGRMSGELGPATTSGRDAHVPLEDVVKNLDDGESASSHNVEDEDDDLPPDVHTGRRSMKERARGVVKQAEKIGHSAATIGQTLFRKRSKSRQGVQDEISPLQSPQTPSPRQEPENSSHIS